MNEANGTQQRRHTEKRHFDTLAVHGGELRAGAKVPGEKGRGGDFYPMSTPIHASTTFSHSDAETADRVLGGEEPGFGYARWGNPTVVALEGALTELECPSGNGRALAVSSGMSAIHAALTAAELTSGSTVLVAEQVYGSTITLLLQVFAPMDVQVRFFDATDLGDLEKKVISLGPRAVVVETISNPLLRVADIPAMARITEAHGAALIVDNTFGTPYLQRPLEFGADIVVHSATKYIAGHGDLTAGVVAAAAPYDAALEQIRKTVGYVMDPFGAWLTLRGLKTLPLRMSRQCENARKVAGVLLEHPAVAAVNHPSLAGHPDGEITARVLSDTGGLVSFELSDGARGTAFRFLNALELCVRAPSLGDIYTIATHPATASHRELPPSRREKLGVTEGLIRLSTGIEHHADITGDLTRALDAL
ncbi:trans-sulfuration enzyme family protein [Rubrobacter indicoceani]|uniref:trans-sulfuration enzyme family protein n=1 Tax=Rubrobacter indicoceani TaxID=2051957 RepID=UPI0013C50105|nr:PLP-dependent aspartate aminotransferase family protein [Rubrobacter indicoceani]